MTRRGLMLAYLGCTLRAVGYAAIVTALGALVPACAGDQGWSGKVPAADFALFQSTAYPVLMSDCAFSECHGAEHRFLQIFGPGRTRLLSATKSDAPVTESELQVSFERARSMLATESGETVERALLLRKPLETTAGGVGHRGVDDYGRNVYATRESPGYQALLHWAHGMAVPASATAGSSAQGAAGSAP